MICRLWNEFESLLRRSALSLLPNWLLVDLSKFLVHSISDVWSFALANEVLKFWLSERTFGIGDV